MKYKLKYLQPALDDIEDIIIYIAKNSKDNAIKLHEKITTNTKRFESFPKLGSYVPDIKIRKQGYRYLVAESYLIFYRIIEDEILIYRILHGKRNYAKLFEIDK